MNLRKVSIDDVELLVKLRIDYLIADLGDILPAEKEAVEAQMRQYLPKHIADGTFIGIIAENHTEVMGSAYLAISERPANPNYISGKIGTLLNVLTYPRYRRQGIATTIINKLIDEARLCGVSRIDLSATNDGKPVYEKIGFHEPRHHTAMSLELE